MKIVLMSDITRNELLVNFCLAYQQILSQYDLVSPINTSRLVGDGTILRVTPYPTGLESATSHLAASARYNEFDALIYLCDPESDYNRSKDFLFRACDVNNIPYATNTAMAEILVLALSRGDLDWRELIR